METFLADLRALEDDEAIQDFGRRTILHGTPYVFDGKEADFYEFRKKIATNFDIGFHEVFITGSGKLGFSPHKQTKFSYESDIDVAIVSKKLFDQLMEAIRHYQMNLRNNRIAVTEKELKKYHEFLEYSAIGWIRPDLLPESFSVKTLKEGWFDFFNSISHGKSEVGNYKVSAGCFKTYRHLELYTFSGLKKIKKALEVN
ncbi:hypothetical protein [Vibrio parahaemolyticus]|uniref:hypothetical protein n=1 Tax=Vibrio parahaemolyticus TaxID=670 RepID=UPI0004150C1F|nr:hypothetical protein [Vibrio parahaemolyticus]